MSYGYTLLDYLWAAVVLSLPFLVAWLHWPTFLVLCCGYIACCFTAVIWEVTRG